MLSLKPSNVMASPGSGVVERLAIQANIQAKEYSPQAVGRYRPLGTSPKNAVRPQDHPALR